MRCQTTWEPGCFYLSQGKDSLVLALIISQQKRHKADSQNKKSSFSVDNVYTKEKVAVHEYSDLFWCARLDSNQRPSGSEPNALSNWATDAHLWKPSEDGFQLFSYKWSNSSQATTKPRDAMPKNGFVMRFFGCARWGVGVVGAERSIQLSYGRTSMKTVRRRISAIQL